MFYTLKMLETFFLNASTALKKPWTVQSSEKNLLMCNVLNNVGKHWSKHFHEIVAVQSRRTKKVNLHQARKKDRSDSQHTRYRHLYQARRATGDVLSQVSYLEIQVTKAIFCKGELPLRNSCNNGMLVLVCYSGNWRSEVWKIFIITKF